MGKSAHIVAMPASLLAGLLLAAVVTAPTAVAQTAGDPARGARIYLQCRACHAVGPAARDGVGPTLNGVVGSRAGTRGGYAYSQAMKASGLTWSAANLDSFLTRPGTVVPGNRMAFAGISSSQARRDLIAYLATQTAAAPPTPARKK